MKVLKMRLLYLLLDADQAVGNLRRSVHRGDLSHFLRVVRHWQLLIAQKVLEATEAFVTQGLKQLQKRSSAHPIGVWSRSRPIENSKSTCWAGKMLWVCIPNCLASFRSWIPNCLLKDLCNQSVGGSLNTALHVNEKNSKLSRFCCMYFKRSVFTFLFELERRFSSNFMAS